MKKILKKLLWIKKTIFTLIRLHFNALIKQKQGVSGLVKDRHVLYVSLTSYPPRFSLLHICLESLLEQDLKPDRLILWIADSDYSKLPKRVLRLQKRGLEIKTCDDLKSYNKIFHLLPENKENIIVTCDDDTIYPPGWLKSLYEAYLENNDYIYCHRARLITFNAKGNPTAYKYWPNVSDDIVSKEIIPLGYGGVLYPPNAFDDKVVDKKLIKNLCPTADDVWLKAMTLLNNKCCRRIKTEEERFITLPGTNKTGLWGQNRMNNDSQIKNVFNAFNINIENFL